MGQYDKEFYSKRRSITALSAGIILDKIFEFHTPDSVIDFGSGTGTWLSECMRRNVETVLGIDGPWVDETDLEIPLSCFCEQDLGMAAYQPARRYDLALCIEVAEHLSESMGEQLVMSLISASDVVAFSAAVVGQGGTGHVNEQPQSYWGKKFLDQGYVCLDLIRPRIWDVEDVNVIYKQNMLVYVKSTLQQSKFQHCNSISTCFELDRVHPDLLEIKSRVLSRKSYLHRCLDLVVNLLPNIGQRG